MFHIPPRNVQVSKSIATDTTTNENNGRNCLILVTHFNNGKSKSDFNGRFHTFDIKLNKKLLLNSIRFQLLRLPKPSLSDFTVLTRVSQIFVRFGDFSLFKKKKV